MAENNQMGESDGKPREVSVWVYIFVGVLITYIFVPKEWGEGIRAIGGVLLGLLIREAVPIISKLVRRPNA
jgi:hypothetical protein